MKKIILIGARIDGHTGVVLDAIRFMGKFELAGFLDNTPSLQGTCIEGAPVFGAFEEINLEELPTDTFHISIGDNFARSNIYLKLKSQNKIVATIIHPQAFVSSRAKTGEGSFIAPGAIVNSGSETGPVNIINSGAIVEHDNKLGIGVHMAPGTKTAGRVVIHNYAFVGIGATILPDLEIGEGAMIGAGATVIKNVEPKTTMIGYAAKIHKKNIYKETKPDV